jgi:hypothetical protein
MVDTGEQNAANKACGDAKACGRLFHGVSDVAGWPKSDECV